jgi:hypothetical protein
VLCAPRIPHIDGRGANLDPRVLSISSPTGNTVISGQLTSQPEERKTADGRVMATASIKARKGRESVEHWRVIAYSSTARAALLRLGVNEDLSVQGSGTASAQRISGDVVLVHTIFAEHVLPLRSTGGQDV